MMNKRWIKNLNFILCMAILVFLMPAETLAMDSPAGGYIEQFPVPGDTDTVITNNYGTINYAKTQGFISYNYYLINNLEGATVGENKNSGTINNFVAGRVDNNYGTINKVNNTASIGTNTLSGVIKENFNTVDKNMGTIENQYSGVIKENYGNVGTIGSSASIEKMYEGTITENDGSVIVCPAPEGIETEVNIGTNKGSVRIEADSDNKSSVVINSNEAGATLHVCNGAECTVNSNAGTIEIEKGGSCTCVTNAGEVNDQNLIPDEEYVYELILDNVNSADIIFVDFFKKVGEKVYVMNGDPNHYVIVTFDTNKYYYPAAVTTGNYKGIPIEDSAYSIVDDENKTFTVHFHTMDKYEHSSGEKHMRKCNGTWNGSECTAYVEEACSLIPATCTSKAKCEKCGTEYGYEASHSYSWVSENGKHKQVCKDCGDTKNVGDCSYGEWIIDSEAKAGVEGRKHRECSVCKNEENETIPALPDNGKKKDDNEQGSKGQNVNPTKDDTAKVENLNEKDTAQDAKTLPKNEVFKKEDSAGSGSEGDTVSNSDRSDEAVISADSMDIDSDSEASNSNSESSKQAMLENESIENKEKIEASNKTKVVIIAGTTVVAAATAAGSFMFSRKKKRKNLDRKA